MRRILLLIVAVLTALTSMAQHVTGKVIESDSQEPVAQTTVKLLKTDSTLAAGVLTKLDGTFSVKAPSAGTYILQVTCVGFKAYTKRISAQADKDQKSVFSDGRPRDAPVSREERSADPRLPVAHRKT